MPQIFTNIEPSNSFFKDNSEFEMTETEDDIITHPSTFFHNKKLSTANSSPGNNHITSSLMTQLFDRSPLTIIETIFHT